MPYSWILREIVARDIPRDSAALTLLPLSSSRLWTMASHSIDSSGLSSLRLTVQHSGGRSFGWIDPSEYLPQLPGITRPARPEQTRHRLGRADQPGCWLSFARKNGTRTRRSSM